MNWRYIMSKDSIDARKGICALRKKGEQRARCQLHVGVLFFEKVLAGREVEPISEDWLCDDDDDDVHEEQPESDDEHELNQQV